MDQYFYLVSQLPLLYFDREPLITIPSFFDEAEKWLGRGELEALSAADINRIKWEKKDPATVKEYIQFEAEIRADLAKWRQAQKNDQEYKPENFPLSLVKDGNPLEVEKKLLEWRWNFMDEKEREHHFDFGKVVLYYLKLQILRRLMTFNKEKGFEKLKMLCEVTA